MIATYVLDRQWGLNQGFDWYDDDLTDRRPGVREDRPQRPGDAVTDTAIAWLEKHHLAKAQAGYEHAYESDPSMGGHCWGWRA